MLVCNLPQFYSYLWPIHTPTVEWIASRITHHFRYFFTSVANTTSTLLGARSGVVGSHEVAGKTYVNSENSQMASIGAIFTSTYHIKQLNP